jgi:hypothetical protein
MKAYGRAEIELYSFLTLVRDGGERLTSCHDRFTPGKYPSTRWIGGQFGRFRTKKILW